MLRAIFLAGLLSIGCTTETLAAPPREECDWAVIWLTMIDRDEPCEWSVWTGDAETARVRSFYGEPSGEIVTCGIQLYERLDHVGVREVIEIWSPGGTDPNVSWAALEQSDCL